MTQPIAHGYPDWARFSAEADVDWLNLTAESIAASTDYGSFFLGANKWVGVAIIGTTNHARYNFAFYRDAALTKLAGELPIHVRAGGQYRGAIPVNGPYLLITVLPSANPTVFDLGVWSAAGPMSGFNSGFTSVLMTVVAQNAPIGSTLFGPTTAVCGGPVHWHVQTSGTDWYAYLRTLEYNGTVTFLDSISWLTGPNTHIVYVPPRPLIVEISNVSAAAKTVDIFLGAPPLQIGS